MANSRRKSQLSMGKAKQMLADNSAQGHPLTDKQKKYFGFIAGGGSPKQHKLRNASEKLKQAMRKIIKIPKSEIVEEHKKLVQTLKHGTKSQLKTEAQKQSKELKEYKNKRK